ncbi:6-carboxytetrahydropterin synthase QueD [Collibacillus ludicampi]|jgi:6-pyruvoyltetrahydropterin/6-carboxytetrahydropterin synthase|uniref:6-carboxy-5,6,7,8-tetrahydropterin synthase n=1 Tax=Collibacillus ludicampi TaxID=2771369 RepID=A0AAV4LAX2_9BACL|nr:6-carboxytetrahydropterin synthase QueD [Collibacillus ludicampi]GIM44853.1 6-carboxytetrahydropterin synthase QueD [Collibacillus ludicampi]
MSNKLRYHSKEVTVTKIFTFDSAHRLDDYVGKCANLHGHTYKLEVSFRGKTDDRGIVVDFTEIKRIVNEQILAKYDHQFLNDHFSFNTTAENMVVFFFELIDSYLKKIDSNQGVQLVKVRLWETPTCYAEIDREAFDREGE